MGRITRTLGRFPRIYRGCKRAYAVAEQLGHRVFGRELRLHPGARLRSLRETLPHFFGYYDKSPWDASGGRMLYHRVAGDGEIALVVYDLQTDEAKVLGTSAAWNWQQGSMLQWWPGEASVVGYNTVLEGELAAVIVDAAGGKSLCRLPMPVQTVRSDGQAAISLNYRRLAVLRPDYGYFCDVSNFAPDQPDDRDGLWRIDVRAGTTELILSIEQLKKHDPVPSMTGARHKVNHAMYAPQGNRLVFMHRWFAPHGKIDRLYSVNDDGSDLYLLADDRMCSHYSWRDHHTLLAYCRKQPWGDGYFLFRDGSDEVSPVGRGTLELGGDGHPSFSPDRRWIVTDTYPRWSRTRRLLLFDVDAARMQPAGVFHSPWRYDGPYRCDLHPRWSPDGRWVAVDSVHTGVRGLFLVDVSRLVSEACEAS